jgi:lipase chaperone LimK
MEHAPPPPATRRPPAPLPPSLRGTDVDGALVVDGSGRFVPNRDAVAMFEYFLTALGEESYDAVVARITAEIRTRLPADQVAAALAFLHQYLDYRDRAGALPDGGDQALRAGFERLRALRREVFGAALAADLFAAEEGHAEVTLLQAEIARDAGLDADARAELIERADALLPEAQRATRQRATAHVEVAETEAALRKDGATDAEIRVWRQERFGPEAADRLDTLDRARAAWNQRVADYRAARSQIERDPTLAEDVRQARLDALLTNRFSAPERRRVRALDRIDAVR